MTPKLRLGLVSALALLACEEPTPPSTVGGLHLLLVRAPGDAKVFDYGRIHVQGQRDTTVFPGQSVTDTGLQPGPYAVAVEGFINNQVENYGETTAVVVAGINKTVSMSFPTFVPLINALPATGTSKIIVVTWSPVASASAKYNIEASPDSTFPPGYSQNLVPRSPDSITVPTYGKYYVRVRAIDPYPGGQGAPSNPVQSITLLSPPSIMLSTHGITFNQFPGPGTYGQIVNITNGGTQALSGLSTTKTYGAGQDSTWLADSLGATSAPATLSLKSTPGSLCDGIDTAIVTVSSSTPGVKSDSVMVALNLGTTVNHLVFTSQPTNTVAGKPIASFQVTAKDGLGNTVTCFNHPITVGISSGTGTPGANLTGSTIQNPVSGVATFSSLSIGSVGSGYTLAASAFVGQNTIQSTPASSAFAITPDTATHLVFRTQPSGGQANTPLAPVQVAALDTFDNVATGFTSSVSLAITPGTGTPGAQLSGSPVAATSGVATFSNLTINQVGNGYTLTASVSGITGRTSNFFNIINGAVSATNSKVIATPASIPVDTGVSTITVTARDGGNNPIQGATVTLSATGSGDTLTQPSAVTDAQGITTGTLKSSVAEAKTVTATISSVTITQQAHVTVTSSACSNCWTAKAPLPTARTGLGVGVINGKLYAVGGYNGGYLDTLEVYDTLADSWAPLKSMPTARRRLAVGVINGKLYAVGGFNGSYLATLEAYDPVMNTWATLKPMNTPRHRLTVAVANGKLYAIGGENTTGSLRTVERYDPVADSWTPIDSLSTARFGLGADSTNGALYAIGGYNGSYPTQTEAYGLPSGPWSTLSATFQLSTGRSGMGVGVIKGLLYVVGGYDGTFLTKVEELNPATGWNPKKPLPSARAGLAVGVINGKLYAVGGDTGGPAFSTVEVFVP